MWRRLKNQELSYKAREIEAKKEVVAQNIQQLAEYLKKIVEKEKGKQPTEEVSTSNK